MKAINRWLAGGTMALMGLGTTAQASTIIGGNATDLASATNVLDIVFAIDTSGSMFDDITQIGNVASAAITNLNCPEDVWVRARFFGIAGQRGSVFDENLRTYLSGLGTVNPNYGSTEDNGWAVKDTAELYNWFQGTEFGMTDLSMKNTYKAVVHIGDEGTENGSPMLQDDWDAAVAANQAAINENVFVFSWVTDDPTNNLVVPVWQAMAEGNTGTNPGNFTGPNCGDTGGALINGAGGLTDAEVQATIQQIICTAGSGGTGNQGTIPVPGTLLLMGMGLGFAGMRLNRKK